MNIFTKTIKYFAFWKEFNVFISSTYMDLVKERYTIANELEIMGYKVTKMEDVQISNFNAILNWSIGNAGDSEIYILLLSYRYGTIYKIDNFDLGSITTMEMFAGCRRNKAITYFLDKPFYDEELLLTPDNYVQEIGERKTDENETINGFMNELKLDAYLHELLHDNTAPTHFSIAFAQSLPHTKKIKEELKESAKYIPRELVDLLENDDLTEEQWENARKSYREKIRDYERYYPETRKKQEITQLLHNAMLKSAIFRNIRSTQELIKFIIADVEVIEAITRRIRFKHFKYLALTVIIFTTLAFLIVFHS